MRDKQLAKLRQQLGQRLAELEQLLAAAFEREPVFPGKVLLSKHRCGKSSCRCAEGVLHQSLRLQVRFKDGLATRCLDREEAESWRPPTEAYKRIRDAQRAFAKWQMQVVKIIDAIEHKDRVERSGSELVHKDQDLGGYRRRKAQDEEKHVRLQDVPRHGHDDSRNRFGRGGDRLVFRLQESSPDDRFRSRETPCRSSRDGGDGQGL